MNKNLWLRWTLATGLALVPGLMAAYMTGIFAVAGDDVPFREAFPLIIGAAVFSALILGILVGTASWQILHPAFSRVRRSAWQGATLAGFLLVNVLIHLAIRLLDLGSRLTSHTILSRPPLWLIGEQGLLLGIFTGAILSSAQWLALRGKVKDASWWIPVSILAWACGMPVFLWGANEATALTSLGPTFLIVGAAGLLAGLLVGGIQGIFLSSTSSVQTSRFVRIIRENL